MIINGFESGFLRPFYGLLLRCRRRRLGYAICQSDLLLLQHKVCWAEADQYGPHTIGAA